MDMTLTLKDVFEKLKTVEGGAEIAATINTEMSSLRNEAAANRIAKDDIMKSLGLEGDKAQDSAKALANLMTELKANKQEPGDVFNELTKLKDSLAEFTKKYEASEAKATEAEAKRVDTLKTTELIKALTNGKAVNPAELVKLFSKENIQLKDDGSLVYIGADKQEMAIQDGVDAYLKANPWAMKLDQQPGGGTTPPGCNNVDYEKMSIDEYFKARDGENKN